MPIIIYHLGGELREVPVRDKTLSVTSLYTAVNSLIYAFNFSCYDRVMMFNCYFWQLTLMTEQSFAVLIN